MRHLKAMQTVIGYRAMLVKVSTPLTKKRDELKKNNDGRSLYAIC